jgi:hypothetical protein
LLDLPFLSRLRRTRLLSSLPFVVLFLSDFFRVRDVSRISHQLIDDSQMQPGRISQGIALTARARLSPILKRADAEKFAI